MAVDRSKVGRRSKNKGKQYEDKCAKMWSTWLYNDITTLRRFSLLSGGHFKHSAHFGRGKQTNIEYVGDFGNIDDPKQEPFCWECKKQEVFDPKQFITALPSWDKIENHKGSSIIDWWEETKNDASVSKRIPVLCASKNRFGSDLVLMDETAAKLLFVTGSHELVDVEDKSVTIMDTYFFDSIPYLIRPLNYIDIQNSPGFRYKGGDIYIFSMGDLMKFDGTNITKRYNEIRDCYREKVYG